MRLTLSTLVMASAVAASVALTPHTASATVVHVPFNFSVSGKQMPAGDYNVTQYPSREFITLTNDAHTVSISWLVKPQDPAAHKIVLKFDESESGNLLRTVQYGAGITPVLDKKWMQKDDSRVHIVRGGE